jgi:hypothetical protein
MVTLKQQAVDTERLKVCAAIIEASTRISGECVAIAMAVREIARILKKTEEQVAK